ncbi:glycosyltransferase family 9 protein [Desulfogranum japonicum]|uniref:glycosyltransferase family 9 protein n=1 Tax=Desulfogranum japonicum TaxID=231447 RepID=UPI000416BB97|nr:glycosyltransferase family 9 protein [Desulfogranum japonicum]
MNLNGQRILIIKQSSLGDVVHTLPLAHALKRTYPSCELGWVIEAGLQDLIQYDSTIDNVFPIHIPSTSEPGAGKGVYWAALKATVQVLASLRKQFTSRAYDIVLDLHASFRSGMLSLTNPGGKRYGFADAKEGNTFFQHVLVHNEHGREHAVEKNLLFCEQLQCAVEKQDFFMETGDGARDRVTAFLTESGYSHTQPLVYINPTARWQSKFWLQERWAALADKLLVTGYQVVFGGSAADVPYIEAVTSTMHRQALIAAGKLSLAQSVALLQYADFYIGLDTGPMHIAAMVNTPVVALFGPTHPERVAPYGVASEVLQALDVDCLCCRMRSCTHHSCMKGITVERVFDALERLHVQVRKVKNAG